MKTQTKKWYNKRAVVLVQPSYSVQLTKEYIKNFSLCLGFVNTFRRTVASQTFERFKTPHTFLHSIHLLSFQSAIRLIKQSTSILYQMGFGVLELHDWLNYRFSLNLQKLDTIVRALYQPSVFRLSHDYPITLGSNCYFSDNLKRSIT